MQYEWNVFIVVVRWLGGFDIIVHWCILKTRLWLLTSVVMLTLADIPSFQDCPLATLLL